MRLTVDQDCIDRGRRRQRGACPVTLAYRKHVNRPGLPVATYADAIVVFWTRYTVRFGLPDEAQAFVKAFDDGGPDAVEPFEFELPEEERTDREGFGADPLIDAGAYPAADDGVTQS